MQTSSVVIPHLDFSSIKTSLQQFVMNYTDSSGRQVFTDYDFEGSNINMMIETLAYNSFFLSYYLNQVANECFLDTAKKRSSVVSISKGELNYIPRSVICAKAKILVTNLDKKSSIIFNTVRFNGRSHNDEVITFSMLNNVNFVYNVISSKFEAIINLYQGIFTERQFEVKEHEPLLFELPNASIDISENLMIVTVKASKNSQSEEIFTRATSIIDLNEHSNVYFIQENWRGFYDIYFGNGLIGKKPNIGSFITVKYFISKGNAGNNITKFFSNAGSGWMIKVLESSYGGQDRETIDNIKFLAPRNYEAQGRCVNINDYITILKTHYQSIKDISVWGGDKNNPPDYGKVFISILTEKDYYYTETQRKNIIDELIRKYSVVTIQPVIVDPDIIYCRLYVLVTYDINQINVTTDDLLMLINQAIVDYFNLELSVFNKNLIYNKLTRKIESVSTAINSCSVDFEFEKRFVHIFASNENVMARRYVLEFSNLIKPGSVTSDALSIGSYDYFIRDIPDDYSNAYIGQIILYRPLYKKAIKTFEFVVKSVETVLKLDQGGYFLPKVAGQYPHGNYTVRIIISSNQSLLNNYSTGTIVNLNDFDIFSSELNSEISSMIYFTSKKIIGATIQLSCDILTSQEEILNKHQGTINYQTGQLILDHFYVTDYSNQEKEVVIRAMSGVGSKIKDVTTKDQTIMTNGMNQVLVLSEKNSKISIRPE